MANVRDKLIKKYWPAIILSLLLLAILDGTVSSLQTCHPTSADQSGSCSIFRGPLLSLIISAGDFFDSHDKGIVAAFTVILAISTIGLWLATISLFRSGENQIRSSRQIASIQARQTRQQLSLARQEFISSHRPRIILRDVHLEGRQVFYMLVNTGDTDATIVESWILGEFVPDGTPIRPLRSPGHDDLGKLALAAGETRDLTYDLPGEIGFAITFPETRRIGIEGRPVFGQRYFTGTIVYADNLGVRRRSVFRRIWDDGRHAFVRLPIDLERDHEYCD
jgi:hypothetical protein